MVITVCNHPKGNINFKKVGIIICNKYASEALNIICFSVNIANKTFMIIVCSNILKSRSIFESFLFQGISQFELK